MMLIILLIIYANQKVVSSWPIHLLLAVRIVKSFDVNFRFTTINIKYQLRRDDYNRASV